MPARQQSDSLRLAFLLSLVGGFLDAYAYLCRGGVFANAQTGNLVLLSVALFGGAWGTALRYVFPICSFLLGVIAAEAIKHRCKDRTQLHWRQLILAVELVFLCAAAFIPQAGNAIVNASISFVCALQMNSFRKVRNSPMFTTMCTGNLRSAAEHLYRGLALKNRAALLAGTHYLGVILLFMVGAGLGALCVRYFGTHAALGAAGLLGVGILLMHDWQGKKRGHKPCDEIAAATSPSSSSN